MDILYMGVGGIIGRTLHNAGAVASNYSPYNNLPSSPLVQNNKVIRRETSLLKYFEGKQDAVMIAASLIAAATFQVGVNPPGGIYTDSVDEHGNDVKTMHKSGISIMANSNSRLYTAFIVENTAGFVASLSVCYLLLTGLPHKYKFFKGFFMVSIWMAIVASYVSSIITVAPPKEQNRVVAFSYVVLVIAILMWVTIILWYAGLGPRTIEFIQKRRGSKNVPTRSGSLLGPATSITRSV